MKAVLAFLLVLGSLAVIHGQMSLRHMRHRRHRPPRPHRPQRPLSRPPHSLPLPVHAWNCSEGPRLNGTRQTDAGMGNVVVSDKSFRIWATKNISPTSCGTSGWAAVPEPGMIEVSSDYNVFGVTTTGKIYQRTGISNGRRQGTGWVYVPVYTPVRHVSYDLCNLWIVTTSGLVMKCSH